jgi:SAM-dependent methyltransferase
MAPGRPAAAARRPCPEPPRVNATPAGYYDGLNPKLLQAIPPGAKRILELGCANGRLGARFKAVSPHAVWHGVDVSAAAVAEARAHLDLAVRMDLDGDDLSRLEGGYDTVVIGDLLEHLRDPGRLLEALYDLTVPDARIVACVPNMSHLSVIERLVAGDASYDPNGLLDASHLRFFTPSSLFKLLLDTGWLPSLLDQYVVPAGDSAFARKIVEAAAALGIPAATTRRTIELYQMVVGCRKWSMDGVLAPGARARFGVVVPVSRGWQLNLNLARSPGLAEIGAPVVCVEGATSAADAWARGARQLDTPWTIMAHQDVYFPRGSGYALAAALAELEARGRTHMPVGFAGLVADPVDPARQRYAGLVVDRRTLFDHRGASDAISMDELAVAMHRDSPLAIDPSLGWHLWATDLCLQTERRAGRPDAELLEIPLFHNSVGDYVVPPEFHASAARLLEKHTDRRVVPTLCGAIQRREPVPA